MALRVKVPETVWVPLVTRVPSQAWLRMLRISVSLVGSGGEAREMCSAVAVRVKERGVQSGLWEL